MADSNSVLRALSVLSLEEILRLSSAEEEILAFEQVAGGEWITGPKCAPTGAKVISFPERKKALSVTDLEPIIEGEPADFEVLNELSLDFILTQRELWKKGGAQMGLVGAIDEYLQQVKVIAITEKVSDEKEKIRFITTQGLLINRKQS